MRAPSLKNKRTHTFNLGGGGPGNLQQGEIPLNGEMIRDIELMFNAVPVIKVALKSFLANTLGEPFSFSIPALGIVNNEDMTKLISAYWMPWLRNVYKTAQKIGVVPYYFKTLKEAGTKEREHKIPVVPDLGLGQITVSVDKQNELRYKWYWNYGNKTDEAKEMLWIVTENHPSVDGTINSPLAALLPNYRSLLKLQKAQDIAVVQGARPVHLIEFQERTNTAANDELTHLVADFGQAAGVSRARLEQQRNQEIRVKTSELYKQLQAAQNANTAKATLQPTMWTETPEDRLEEMDAGFSNRVVVMRPNFKYAQSARPMLLGDYYKAEQQFNLMAAAIMDFALELLTPTGSSRSQNVEGSARFENERIKEQTSFFTSVLQPALVLAYREQFQQTMDDARNWRISKLKGDPSKVAILYPELDVRVDMSSSTVTDYSEMRQMLYDGLITKETMGKHVARSRNFPPEQITNLEWPDKVPREMLVKPEKPKDGPKAPPKKKIKKTTGGEK